MDEETVKKNDEEMTEDEQKRFDQLSGIVDRQGFFRLTKDEHDDYIALSVKVLLREIRNMRDASVNIAVNLSLAEIHEMHKYEDVKKQRKLSVLEKAKYSALKEEIVSRIINGLKEQNYYKPIIIKK